MNASSQTYKPYIGALEKNHFSFQGYLEENPVFNFLYEKENHLGSVHAVVSDRKLQVEDVNNTGTVAYYQPNVISYTDYYPFGMQIGHRSDMGSSYRYGFQEQEIDPNAKGNGNSVNFKYRMHDPRIGRFFAVDPLEAKYPWNTPYSFSENSVIAFIELEGLERYYYCLTYVDEDTYIADFNGNIEYYDKYGNRYEDETFVLLVDKGIRGVSPFQHGIHEYKKYSDMLKVENIEDLDYMSRNNVETLFANSLQSIKSPNTGGGMTVKFKLKPQLKSGKAKVKVNTNNKVETNTKTRNTANGNQSAKIKPKGSPNSTETNASSPNYGVYALYNSKGELISRHRVSIKDEYVSKETGLPYQINYRVNNYLKNQPEGETVEVRVIGTYNQKADAQEAKENVPIDPN